MITSMPHLPQGLRMWARKCVAVIARARQTGVVELSTFRNRIALYVLVWTFAGLVSPFMSTAAPDLKLLFIGHAITLAGTLWNFIQFLRRPTYSDRRVDSQIIIDNIAVTVTLVFGGPGMSLFVVAYLWSSLGTGFRFGKQKLVLSCIVSVLNFCVVAAMEAYWREHIEMTIMVLAVLVVAPAYAATLVTLLHRMKRQAEAANEAKSRFLATMSHELRTPLNAVIGLATVLEKSDLDTDQRQMTRSIKSSGGLLLEMVSDVLTLSRIEAGRQPVKSETFDLYDLVATIRFALEPLAEAKGLYFHVRMSASTPRQVISDRGHLQKILLNLAGNAVKFTETGGVIVDLDCQTGETGGAVFSVHVADTGIGIPQEMRETIFDRFSQVDANAQNALGGAGLGLAICRNLASLLEGDITLESAVGAGSTFKFSMPLAITGEEENHGRAPRNMHALVVGSGPLARAVAARLTDIGCAYSMFDRAPSLREWPAISGTSPFVPVFAVDAAAGKEALLRFDALGPAMPVLYIVDTDEPNVIDDIERRRVTARIKPDDVTGFDRAVAFVASCMLEGGASPVVQIGPARRVLVAEDNETNRQVIQRMLNELGHRIVFASNGDEALDHLAESRFDIVFMDVNMPVLDGLEATKLLRAGEAGGPQTPVVALTADVTPEGRKACLEAGMNAVVYKPVHMSDIAVSIQQLCDGQASSGHAPAPVEHEETTYQAAGKAPALDQRRIAELHALDPDGAFVRDVAEAFFSDAAELLQEARAALAARDVKALQDVRHAFRSTAMNLGAAKVDAVCLSARDIGSDQIAEVGPAFLAELGRALCEVRDELANRAGVSIPEEKVQFLTAVGQK